MPELLPLEQVLANAEQAAVRATELALQGVPPDALTETRTFAAASTAFATASRAWSEYAIARTRCGHKLEPAEIDPREALRRRAGR